jgi:hypothetical protein
METGMQQNVFVKQIHNLPLACKQCEICHEIVDFYLKLNVVTILSAILGHYQEFILDII